jgi:hypothetical protein
VANPPGIQGKVIYQQETVDLGPDGRAVQGVKVGFMTAKGIHGSVFIPKARYNVETVRAAVGEQAAKLDAIHDLSV